MSAEGERAERRERLIKLGSATAFLAIVVVAVLIVIGQSQSDGGDAGSVDGAAEVRRELDGIPQRGLVLGDPKADVRLIEFGDLQCPVCKGYAEEVVPPVIESKVRSGEAKLDFRNFTIIDEESTDAAAAAIAAGEQGRGWDFLELFYRNQGIEATGYVTDEFLTAVAEAAGVPDVERWNAARVSDRVIDRVGAETAEAQRLGFTGTPSFAVEGPATDGLETLGTPGSTGDLEAAVEGAR
ncbi:MAG TPA: thioredoxin domain-containing protein [Solirubrobacterales bacterium]|nr:thioredoxin domain-containing protein [Solirubrobacterales bacterium]